MYRKQGRKSQRDEIGWNWKEIQCSYYTAICAQKPLWYLLSYFISYKVTVMKPQHLPLYTVTPDIWKESAVLLLITAELTKWQWCYSDRLYYIYVSSIGIFAGIIPLSWSLKNSKSMPLTIKIKDSTIQTCNLFLYKLNSWVLVNLPLKE